MRRIFLILFIVGASSGIAQVQENLLFEKNYMNSFNPAFVGSEGKVFTFVTRLNWNRIPDPPRTNYFYYVGETKKNLTFGFSAITNKISIDRRTQVNLDASYQLKVSNTYRLFLGVKTGISTRNTDPGGLNRITTEVNPYISTSNNAAFPVFGLGFMLQSEKSFLSLGTSNILSPKIFLSDADFMQYETPVLYAVAGTTIFMADSSFSIKPFVSVKVIPRTKDRINIGTTLNYKNRFDLGGGFTTDDFAFFTLSIKTKNGLEVGISSDFRMNIAPNPTGGGSEIFLKYPLSKRKAEQEEQKSEDEE